MLAAVIVMGDDNADSGSCQRFKHSHCVTFDNLKVYSWVTLMTCTPVSLPLTYFLDLCSFLACHLPTLNQITTILNYVYHFSTLKVPKNILVHIPKQYRFFFWFCLLRRYLTQFSMTCFFSLSIVLQTSICIVCCCSEFHFMGINC